MERVMVGPRNGVGLDESWRWKWGIGGYRFKDLTFKELLQLLRGIDLEYH